MSVAWLREMDAGNVEYHATTIGDRADDATAFALDYYGSRGATPMAWGGRGAGAFGLAGPVDPASFAAVFAPGGAVHPGTGERLTATKRPGFECVTMPPKSVAILGLLGRPGDAHAIADHQGDARLPRRPDRL